MAFNFPNSPANGASYTPVGGPTFTWDGTAWKALSQGMPVTVFVGDVAPGAPAFGNLWWESDTGNLYIYYNDGDSAQWVQVNGTPAGYQTALSRNLIVNPAMQISQENGGTGGSTNTYYPADQWPYVVGSGITGVAFVNTSLTTPSRYILFQCTTAQTSLSTNAYIGLRQKLEGINIGDLRWGLAEGRPAVLRLFCHTTTTPGLYSIFIRNNPIVDGFVGSFEITSADVAATVATGEWVEKIVRIPAPPVGTVWSVDNSIGLELTIILCAATYLQRAPGWGTATELAVPGQVNFLASTANRFRIRGVGLYIDPQNTGMPPPWEVPDEAEELRACQRYWWKTTSPVSMQGYRTCGTAIASYDAGTVSYPATMRVSPAAAITTAPTYVNCSLATILADATSAIQRVTPSAAAANFRAASGVYEFNARL